MANNIDITPGSGKTVATDDVSGVSYQRVKLVDGTEDSTTAVAADANNGLFVHQRSWTPFFLNAFKPSTPTTVISTATGLLGGYMAINLNTAPIYLQIFDLAAATTITLGTTVPTFVIPIPANSTPANGAAAHLQLGSGIVLALGLRVVATTTATGSGIITTGISGYLLYATP